MVKRLLASLVALALRRPWALLLPMIVPAAISLLALRVPVDFSFAALMDRDHPEVARYFEVSERFGLGGLLPLLLEGDEERLAPAVAAMVDALAALPVVRGIAAEPASGWIEERAPWLVEPAAFDAWLTLLRDPQDTAAREALERGTLQLELRAGGPRPSGARLLLVTMTRDSFELALDADDFVQIRAEARRVASANGVSARFAGMAAIVTQEQEATIGRMAALGGISLLLVIALLRVIERRPLVLLGVTVPMLLAVGTTLALVGLTSGKLTIMESVFGVLVFGLGVDFAIHLLLRLREELGAGVPFASALERTFLGTGRGVVAGAVTSGGAFLILAFSPDPVFYQLGLSGGLGLLLCLLFLLVMLPAQWVLLERRARASARPVVSRRPLQLPGLAAAVRFSTRRPGWVVGAVLVLCAWALAAPDLRYETDISKVFSREIRALDTARRIHSLFGVDPGPWIVAVDSLEQARRVTAGFEREELFPRTDSLAFLFPTDLEARAARLADAAAGLAHRGGEGTPSEAPRLPPEALALLRAHELGPPTLAALPPALSERLLGPDGQLLVYAFARAPHLDSELAAVERRAAQAIHPEATSMAVIYEALLGAERPWMGTLGLGVALFIALVLMLDLRSPRLVLLALAPVSSASLVSLGLLAWAGFTFNTVTFVAVPLVLGLGVDDGIHVVHRLREQAGASLESAVASVGTGIAMTTLTTCGSVAALLFSRHPGIESIAVVMLLGLSLSWLASVTLLPALAVLSRSRLS